MKLLFLASILAIGGAVIQELTLHESNEDQVGNSHIFREAVPDLTIFPFINKIVRVCHTASCVMYTGTNFEGNVFLRVGPACSGYNTEFNSIRFYGNRNTSVDAVSLYPDVFLSGEELYVDQSPYGGIAQNMLSVGYSGKSAWTVFEGSYFDGKSACLEPGYDTNYYYNVTTKLNITGVKSLFKGCVTEVSPEMRKQLQEEAFGHQFIS